MSHVACSCCRVTSRTASAVDAALWHRLVSAVIMSADVAVMMDRPVPTQQRFWASVGNIPEERVVRMRGVIAYEACRVGIVAIIQPIIIAVGVAFFIACGRVLGSLC